MNEKIGNVSFYDPSQENTFQKPFSEETGKIIDEEVRKMIDAAYHRTLDLLTLRKGEVEKLAKELLDKEVLHKSDVEALIGMRPYEEEKVVTFDVEESKTSTAEQSTNLTDAAAPVEPSTNNEASTETHS